MPTQLNIPTDGTNRMNKPRASYRTDDLNFDIDVWCIEDLMPADVNGSNSEEKHKSYRSFSIINSNKHLQIQRWLLV